MAGGLFGKNPDGPTDGRASKRQITFARRPTAQTGRRNAGGRVLLAQPTYYLKADRPVRFEVARGELRRHKKPRTEPALRPGSLACQPKAY